MSLSQQLVISQKGDKSSFQHLFNSIKLLTQESDHEKFNKIASDLQAAMRDEFKIPQNTQDLLTNIKEELNKVRMGSHKDKPVGQGNVSCCSYMSLMFIYLI